MKKYQNLNVKAGELICFSSGEYSDYHYRGHFVVLKDISEEYIKSITSDIKSQYGGYGETQEKFIARLISDGFLLSLNCREIYIGSYGDLDVS